MAGIFNFTWSQGEDLNIYFIYKTGPSGTTPVPVNLTGYSLRMDIAPVNSSTPLYTANTNDNDASTVDEAVLGSDGSVTIIIPRTVLLPGGAFYPSINGPDGVTEFDYDIFLKSPTSPYIKILKGKIYIDKSVTLW